MHESDRRGELLLAGKPMSDEALATILGLDKQNLTTTITRLLEYGVASKDPTTGALVNRRMVRDENLRKIRQNAGKLGGNPVLLNQKPTTHVKQKPTPSSSSSSSSSIASSTSVLIPLALQVDVFTKAWEQWLDYRKQIKHPLKSSTQEAQLQQFEKWGIGRSVAAIEFTILKGWQGLQEPKPGQNGLLKFSEPNQIQETIPIKLI